MRDERRVAPDGPRGRPWAGCALALLVCTACAAPGSDLHLAPLWTRANAADGAREVEALGGFYLRREEPDTGDLLWNRYGPLWGHEPVDEDPLTGEKTGWVSHFLVPLGQSTHHGRETATVLYPLFVQGEKPEKDGTLTWQLAALPGILVESNEVEGTQFGIFPLWGRFRDFVTFDQLIFVLWPLFVYAEREERISYHFLWPFIGWTTGGGETSWRIFPFYSHTKWEGRYDRRFVMWPFFHYHRNFLGGGGEEPETKWMLWPLWGHTERGTFDAWTTLWPFFGYSRDPRSDFWALDFPWPFVRFQRGGTEGKVRSRIWPFFSFTQADGLVARSFLWPFVQLRHEHLPSVVRDSTWVIPIWQSMHRQDRETGAELRWKKLWPLFQYENDDGWRRGSFPTLDPFWRNTLIDRHYSWIWKVWEWESEGRMRRERAWLGLYRREKDRREDRRSVTGLWSSRRYHDAEERCVTETSLLFGLLRWRVTRGEGFDMLAPALPGPGWPARSRPSDAAVPEGR